MTILYLAFIFLPLLAIVALLMTEKGAAIKQYIHFVATGLDSGFHLKQILFLGKIGKACGLENLTTLFWSVQELDRCTAEIVRRSRQTATENDPETQAFLSNLYTYRTKIELDNAKKRRGLDSSRDMVVHQKIRILLRGVGVFSSKVVRITSKTLVIDFPSSPKIAATSIDWTKKPVSVYFWRHDDAGYVFDSVVVPDPVSAGKAVLHIAHSNSLIRSQKRKSIRVKCSIYAQMYLVKPDEALESVLEPEPGMKCLLEDISEDGAMIIIGGKAVKDMRIKLQFMIHDVLIVMAGVIRAVEFNPDTNQSRIHFECGELNPRMKNAVLTFVYNVLPEEEKEELDAIRLTEEDGIADAQEADVTGKEHHHANPAHQVEEMDELAPDLPDFAGKQ